MNKLYLDIETIPAPESSHKDLEKLFKKKKKKGEYEDFEQYLSKTSFDGTFGQIICIAYASNDNPVEVLYNENNEALTLRQFWELARDHDLFIGHNVMEFDLRFIYQRSIINRVRPTKDLSFARYRNNPIFDTMKEWVRWGSNNLSLEHIATALGIPSPKDELDGSQVFSYYQKGKIKEILKYCKKDVEVTRAVYKRMCFLE